MIYNSLYISVLLACAQPKLVRCEIGCQQIVFCEAVRNELLSSLEWVGVSGTEKQFCCLLPVCSVSTDAEAEKSQGTEFLWIYVAMIILSWCRENDCLCCRTDCREETGYKQTLYKHNIVFT